MKSLSRIRLPRRIRHCIRILLLVLALVSITTTAVAQAQPLTGTFTGAIIGRTVRFMRNNRMVNDFAGVLKLQLDNGPLLPVFCVQVDVAVRPSDRYRSDGAITHDKFAPNNSCKIRYLVDRYPASTVLTADEAAARQMAIWHYSDGVDLNTISDTNTLVRDRALALKAEADANPCPDTRSDIPVLTLAPPSATVAAGQEVTYTVSAGPGSAGQNVQVSVTGSAVLSNGQQQMAVPLDAQGNAIFSVANASEGASTVTVALPTQLDAGTVFSQIDNSNPTQRLVLGDRYDFSVSATVSASWGPPLPTPTAVMPTATTAPTSTPLPTATPLPTSKPAPKPPAPPEETPVPATPSSGPEQPSAPAGPTDQTATPTPDTTGGSGAPASTPQAGQPGAAGGAAPVRPRTLPRTGGPADLAPGLGVAFAALLLACGWLVHRRGTRH